MQSKVKIFGHALHPMLIPFPIAFNTATLFSIIIYASTSNIFWFQVGFVANAAAILTSIVAILPGLIDWFSIPEMSDAKNTGLKHMVANVFTLGFFVANAAINYQNLNNPHPPFQASLMLTIFGFLVMMYAGYKGWKMVQSFHIGIDPEQRENLPANSSVEKNANEIFTDLTSHPEEKK